MWQLLSCDQPDFVTHEKACLDKFFPQPQQRQAQNNSSSSSSCIVYLLSDRTLTVDILSDYVKNTLQCTPKIVNHTALAAAALSQPSYVSEHGKFASGFYADWALAANARHGIFASRYTRQGRVLAMRTSSALVVSTIQYRSLAEGKRPLGVCHK